MTPKVLENYTSSDKTKFAYFENAKNLTVFIN